MSHLLPAVTLTLCQEIEIQDLCLGRTHNRHCVRAEEKQDQLG